MLRRLVLMIPVNFGGLCHHEIKKILVSDVIRILLRVSHEKVLLVVFCFWSDTTEVCEEETAGAEPTKGKGGEKKARSGQGCLQYG